MTVRQCAATFRPGLDQLFSDLEAGRNFLAAQQLFRLLENLVHRPLFHGWQFTVRARSGHHNSFLTELGISLDSRRTSLVRDGSARVEAGLGGGSRTRTGIDGFAGRCMTLLPSRPAYKKGKARSPHRAFPSESWSGKRVSNSRPQPWQGCALPTELFPQVCELYQARTAAKGRALRK